MTFLRKLNQKGDTIVEVLIVLAILGLAFAISTSTATKSLQQARNAEEHGQAMGVLNGQIEMLRKALANKISVPTSGSGSFCMVSPTVAPPVTSTQCKTGAYALYNPSISFSSNTYTLTVTWPGLNGSQQTEIYNYKVYPASANTSGSFVYTTVPAPPAAPSSVSDWSAFGGAFISCTPAEAVVGDGFDGCFTPGGAGGAVYGRRAYDAVYSLGSSTSTSTRTATLKIYYSQYKDAGTTPPADYDFFSVLVKFGPTDPGKTIHLGVSNSSADWNITTPSSTSVTIPANASTVEIRWQNNSGTDPDLQINSISVSGS